jgi:hypothetical protein
MNKSIGRIGRSSSVFTVIRCEFALDSRARLRCLFGGEPCTSSKSGAVIFAIGREPTPSAMSLRASRQRSCSLERDLRVHAPRTCRALDFRSTASVAPPRTIRLQQQQEQAHRHQTTCDLFAPGFANCRIGECDEGALRLGETWTSNRSTVHYWRSVDVTGSSTGARDRTRTGTEFPPRDFRTNYSFRC